MKIFVCLLGLFYTASLLANDIKIIGTIQQTVDIPKKPLLNQPSLENNFSKQIITLLKIELSDKALKTVTQRLNDVQSANKIHHQVIGLPSNVQLGMENVPVSNQGVHGSCVTFAISAVLNALIKQSDYVSELCTLQLGRYLQSYGYNPSGWNGSLGAVVLAQLDAFGFMTKAQQRQYGCGGLTEYPLLSYDTGTEVSLSEFHQHSQSLGQNRIVWTVLLNDYQSLHEGVDGNVVLNQVKNALSNGDRLTFGVLLADYEKGLAGALGSYKSFNDTWLLTPEIIEDMKENPQFAGHEMVITGYNDRAYAKDDHGRLHYGLLTLRNSWGDRIGNQGDFYMSYDYFKELVLEMQRAHKVSKDND